jgi:hypothetical protein
MGAIRIQYARCITSISPTQRASSTHKTKRCAYVMQLYSTVHGALATCDIKRLNICIKNQYTVAELHTRKILLKKEQLGELPFNKATEPGPDFLSI